MRRFILKAKLIKLLISTFFIFCFLLPTLAQTEDIKGNSNYGITLSFPWINYYNYVNYYQNQSKRTFGFFGLGFSGYYKKDLKKVSVNFSFTEDLSSPVSLTNFSKKDFNTSIGCSYFEILFHKPFNENLFLVLGGNITNYNFRLNSTIDSIASYKKTDQTLGLSAGIEYRFNKYYSVAGMYRPTLASFETDGKYRHLINFEFRIDLDFKRKKTNSGESISHL